MSDRAHSDFCVPELGLFCGRECAQEWKSEHGGGGLSGQTGTRPRCPKCDGTLSTSFVVPGKEYVCTACGRPCEYLDAVNDEADVCGEAFDHDIRYVYEGPDGIQWVCRRCGAEGFDETEDSA